MDAVDLQTSNTDSHSTHVENGPKDAGTANQASLNSSFRLEIAEDLTTSADRNRTTTPPRSNVEASLEGDLGDVLGTQHQGQCNDSNQSPEKVNNNGENQEGMVKQKSKKKILAVKEKIRAEKSKSPKQENKRRTRRSLKTSFKDILKSIEEKIAAEGTDVALPGLKAVKVEGSEALGDEIIQSSYTPLHCSETEKPLPFEFSSASIFSKAARNFVAGSFADSESSANNVEGTDKDENINAQAHLNGNIEVTANEDAVISNESSISPDFIPSSQSQRDATPILKGVTMANPRRSFRRVKKTERFLEAESSNAIKISLAKLSQTVLCKMGNMRKKQGDHSVVNEKEDTVEEQSSLKLLGVIQEEEQVNLRCNEHQEEAVAEEAVADIASEETAKRMPTGNENIMNSKEELLNGFRVVPDNSAKATDSMFDNEMDIALLEMDIERASEKEKPMKDNLKSTSYEERGESVPQKRRSKKNEKKKSIRENGDKLVVEADNDERMNGVNGNQHIGGEDDKVNSNSEHTGSKRLGRRSRRKKKSNIEQSKVDIEHNKADIELNKIGVEHNKADIGLNKADIEHNKVERSDIDKRRRIRGSKSSKIDKFSNESSGDTKLLTRRSTRSSALNKETKVLAVETSDSVDKKESAAASELGVEDCISPRKSCTGDTNDICQDSNAGYEDCPIDSVSDSNGKDLADTVEASPSASLANVKRKRKSRKRVADRDKRSSSRKGKVELVADLSTLKEVEESEENNRAEHVVSSKEESVCEKVQDNAKTVSSDLGLDENAVKLQTNVIDIPRRLDGISSDPQGNIEKVFAHDRVEESHEATDDSTQFVAVENSEGEIMVRSKLAASELECASKLPLIDKIYANFHRKEDPVPLVNSNEKSKAKKRTPRKVSPQKHRKPKARMSRTDLVVSDDCDENAVCNSETMKSPSKAQVAEEDESESSSEDSLTLSEISTRTAKEQRGITCSKQGAKRNSYSTKENKLVTLVGRVEENQMAGNSVEGLMEDSEGDADIMRKKELGNFPSNIASETIENIFKSPDNNEEIGNQLLPQRDTFLVLERTSIEESDIATIAKDDVKQTKIDSSCKTGDMSIPSEKEEKIVDDFQRGGPSSNLRNNSNLAGSRVSERSRERSESQHVSMASRFSAFIDSPKGKRKGIGEFSPRSGILKRRAGEKPDTPSPPNKVFNVYSLRIFHFCLLLLKKNAFLPVLLSQAYITC